MAAALKGNDMHIATCETNGHLWGGYEKLKCIFCGTPKPADTADDDAAEAAYWRFDARRNGLGEWKGMPMSERDAFKAEYRNAMRTARVIATTLTAPEKQP